MVHRHRSILPVEDQFLELAMDIYREYVRTLEENNWEDFDGLIRRAIDYIEKGRVIFGEKGDFRRIKHIMIDEYQDSNDLQENILNAVARRDEGRVGMLVLPADLTACPVGRIELLHVAVGKRHVAMAIFAPPVTKRLGAGLAERGG